MPRNDSSKQEYPWVHLQTLTFCYWLQITCHNLTMRHAPGAETVLEYGVDTCPD